MTSQLKQCPKCKSMVSEKNFEKHLKKQHNPEAEKKRFQLELELKEAKKKKLEEGKRIIKCVVCGAEVTFKNIEKHHNKMHPPSMGKADNKKISVKANKRAKEQVARDEKHRKKYPNATLSHMTPAQQSRHLNKLFGADRESGEDIYDKGKTVQGGGYGLGKNSKH